MNGQHGCLAAVFAGLLFMGATHSAYATGSGDGIATKAHRIEIKILNHKVVQETVIKVVQGDVVELVWITDEVTSLHFHGYDIKLDVTPNAPGIMAFTAYATGRFPITSHRRQEHQHNSGHETLLYLEVHPK